MHWENTIENQPENTITSNNTVTIIGRITTEQEFSHEVYGEGFYKFYIESPRLSDTSDIIPVTVSERLCDQALLKVGTIVHITGQLRSYNNYANAKNRLILTVFAKEIQWPDDPVLRSVNQIFLDGFICKKPIYRKTPFGREISDILIAVNRAYSKSDYIPLIAWGRNARYGNSLEVGDNIKIWGRVQSRIYQKRLENDETVEKTAFEVSISKIEKKDKENPEHGDLEAESRDL